MWQRWFIIVRQPTRSYPDTERDNPFSQVTLSPMVTPDLDEPPEDRSPFVPSRNGMPFGFTLTTVDRGGGVTTWSAPLVFVQVGKDGPQTYINRPELASSRYFLVRQIQGRGQSLAVAAPVKAGDTSVEVAHLVFNGVIDPVNVTSRPFLVAARAIVPSMRHLAPQAPAVDLVYAKPYLSDGLQARALNAPPVPGTPNAGELILALKSPPAAVDFSRGSDRAGGFVSPNLSVRGISRALGAIGESGDAPSAFDGGTFDPASFLAGAITKMLTEAQRLRQALTDAQDRLAQEVAQAAHSGAQAVARQAKDKLDACVGPLAANLDALIGAVQGLPGNPGAVSAAAGLAQLLAGAAGGQVTARMQWNPASSPWGLPGRRTFLNR